MKFSTAWASIASENFTLKTVLALLSGVCAVLCILLVAAKLEPPLVIERGCSTAIATLGAADRTEGEVKAFLTKALADRFDSANSVGSSPFLTRSEQDSRAKEMAEFSGRGIKQRVVVNQISVAKGAAVVDADRLLSVGAVRSAFSFPLKLEFAKVSRSEQNPYGLVVTGVSLNTAGKTQ